ncbi:sporulation protein YqfC [Caloramator fervidus]|uniref:Sporulation protein YqfC n=1 Tax=Caloramator fervidus TaxID=29344 RepID=A0A1H5UGV9_9CLOT|nr:sporulation protein YqfC [Caloramator fervidus]SEF74285.1 sporulation protein YqfC [Caloramator fervidus]
MDLKRRLSDALDIPQEIVMNVPSLKVVGDSEIIIENHKGIIEYGKNVVRVDSNIGIINIKGSDFIIKSITQDEIELLGKIEVIEYIK